MDGGSYADAITSYRASYELSRNPALLYNIGSAYERLGDYPRALAYLEQFSLVAPEELRSRVPALSEILASVRGRLARVLVGCNVPGARVIVRGSWKGTTPLEGSIVTMPGPAHVEVVADGYQPFARDLLLPAGRETRLDATLLSSGVFSNVAREIPRADGTAASRRSGGSGRAWGCSSREGWWWRRWRSRTTTGRRRRGARCERSRRPCSAGEPVRPSGNACRPYCPRIASGTLLIALAIAALNVARSSTCIRGGASSPRAVPSTIAKMAPRFRSLSVADTVHRTSAPADTFDSIFTSDTLSATASFRGSFDLSRAPTASSTSDRNSFASMPAPTARCVDTSATVMGASVAPA